MKNTLIGTKVLKPVTYQIEILKLSKEVPNEEIPEFILWLQNQSLELGTGNHYEHYVYSADWQDDIGTTFVVKAL